MKDEILNWVKGLHVKARKNYASGDWDAGWHDALFAIERYLVELPDPVAKKEWPCMYIHPRPESGFCLHDVCRPVAEGEYPTCNGKNHLCDQLCPGFKNKPSRKEVEELKDWGINPLNDLRDKLNEVVRELRRLSRKW